MQHDIDSDELLITFKIIINFKSGCMQSLHNSMTMLTSAIFRSVMLF